MTKTRIKFNNIVKNQLPSYVREEFPLISEFLSQYYLSQEFKGAPIDLIQNIDQYIKIDEQTNLVNSLNLKNDISFFDDTIFVSNLNVETGLDSGTDGFPESYGLIKIDDEIITYTGKTQDSFTGCIRGFSGISSIETSNKLDELTFSTSESAEHKANSEVINLTNLFLTEFLKKIKYQLIPGFEDRSFSDKLNERLFIKQAKDFYRSKGTDESFRILFKTLYGEKVNIIKPKENMISPSNAQYLITNDLVVESLSGDPLNLENQTLYQDEYQNISRSYAPITKVEKITSNEGKDYYKLSVDAGYNRDITVDGSIYGNFSIHPKTRVIGEVLYESTIIDVDSTIGFPNEGELFVTYNDGTMGVVYYNSKSLTQFLDCSNILGIISDSSEISINTYAYAKISSTEIIKVRINSVLKDVEIVDDSYYTGKGQFIQIKTLGVNSKDFISNNWIYNLATEYEIDSITEEDTLNKIYKINFKNSHIFRKGDSILIIDPLSQKQSKVDSVISDKEIIVSGQGNLSLKTTYKVKRNLLKTNTVKYPEISNINTNIQNIYKSKTNTLVTSPSIPSYVDQSLETFDNRVIFSGTFPSTGIASTDIFQITENYDHGFYTGDIIYYYPEKH